MHRGLAPWAKAKVAGSSSRQIKRHMPQEMSRSRSPPGQIHTLPPVSFQYTAAAEAKTIRSLRREVLRLTLTVDALKKGSDERGFLIAKLKLAREELDAMIEDQQIFLSMSGDTNDDTDDRVFSTPIISCEEGCERLHPDKIIPTPPLFASSLIIQQLENKLLRATKYSLEWFQVKKEIDLQTLVHFETTRNNTPTNTVCLIHQR